MCSLSDKEVSEFQQHLEKNFAFNDPTKVKKGLLCAGKQPGDNVWVINRSLHINEDGIQIPESESKWIWQPIGGPCIDFSSKNKNMPYTVINLQSDIKLPLQSVKPLNDLLELMKKVFKHNFIPCKSVTFSQAYNAFHQHLYIVLKC